MNIPITPAQARIAAELVRDGADNRRIANRLGLSLDTVKCQLYRVMTKASAPDRTALAVSILRGSLVLEVCDNRYRTERVA